MELIQPPKQPLFFQKKREKKIITRPGKKRMLCADEITAYLSFSWHPVSSVDRAFRKGGQWVLEGSTLLPHKGFLTRMLTVLVNPS